MKIFTIRKVYHSHHPKNWHSKVTIIASKCKGKIFATQPDVVIEIRSDGGSEFSNGTVREYCNKNNIIHHILPKSHPWLNAFIERAIETLQYEFINLQYHETLNDFQNFLVIAKNGYNLREHSSFNYRSLVEIWNSSGVSLSVTAGGLWT